MALNLGTLNLVLRADSDNLVATLRNTQKRITTWATKNSESVGAFRKQWNRLSDDANRFGRRLNGVTSNFFRLLNKMRALAFLAGTAAAAVHALAESMVALGGAAAGAFVNIQLEPLRDRLESIGVATGNVSGQVDRFSNVAKRAGVNVLSTAEGMGDFTGAFVAAGNSIDEAIAGMQGFVSAAATMGQSSQEINQTLEGLAEGLREGELTMGHLREAVSFTNDPLALLADTFDKSEMEIRAFIEAEKELSGDRLVQLSEALRQQAGEADSLSNAFNRLVADATTMFREFNKAGVIEALKDQFRSLGRALNSDMVGGYMERLAKSAEVLIRETLPNLAKSVINNWGTIQATIKGVIGFLIGTAAGGPVGGALGAFIGASGLTSEAFGAISKAAELFGPAFKMFVIPALKEVIGWVKDTIGWFEELGKALGTVAGMAQAGPATIEGKYRAAKNELERLLDQHERLRKEMEGLDESQVTPGMVEGLEKTRENIRSTRDEVNRLKDTLDFQRGQLSSGGGGDGGSVGDGVDLNVPDSVSIDRPDFTKRVRNILDRMNKDLSGGGKVADPGGFETPQFPGDMVVPEELQELVEKLDVTIDQAERLNTAANDIGDAFADSFTRAVIEGEKLSDVINSLGKDIARIILRQGVSKPLANAVSSGITNMFTGGTGTTAAQGMVQSGAGAYAKGGVADEPSVFGEAGPEAAVPLPDGRNIPVDMKGGGTTVIVNDMRGGDSPEIEQEEREGADGKRMLELTIRDTVSGQFQRGELDGPMRKRYGVTPRTRGRG